MVTLRQNGWLHRMHGEKYIRTPHHAADVELPWCPWKIDVGPLGEQRVYDWATQLSNVLL